MLINKGRLLPWRMVKPDFFVRDHLGSVRAVVSGDGRVLETNSYYPYGMKIDALSSTNYTSSDVPNRYKYNGKELFSESGLDWYNFGKRFYDAAVARFWGRDALSDKFVYLTPYDYAGDNPVTYIDLWGLQPAVPQPYIGFALDRPHEYSGFVDRGNDDKKRLEGKIKEGTWSIGFSGTVCAGLGVTAEIGFLYNKGKKRIYFTIGEAYGVDLSGGLDITYYKAKKKISAKDIEGWGEGYNLGLSMFDFGKGGNSMYTGLKPKNFRDYHSKYDTYSVGISFGPNPIGFTKEKTYTKFFKL